MVRDFLMRRLPRSADLLRLGTLLGVSTLGWAVGAMAGWWHAPLWGWAGPIGIGALAALGCARLAYGTDLGESSIRFWRCMCITMVLVTLGATSNMFDALGGPDAPSQRVGPLTLGTFSVAVLVTQIGLMRLPASHRQGRSAWLRFGLDSGAVMVTVAVFAWHFSFRHYDEWLLVNGTNLAALVVVILGFAAVVAIYKIFSLGVGDLDRGVMRRLALAVGGAAGAGALSPYFAAHPIVSDAHLSVPVGGLLILLAARRQEARGREVEAGRPPRRRWSVAPYLALAAVNCLLLAADRGPDGQLITIAAVVLSTLVVGRQIVAFAEHNRLLDALDASVGELRWAHDQLAHQATHDALTGLGNRRLLHDRVEEALAGQPGEAVHLILIDLDDFKQVNDRLGHATGDALLRAVADRLRELASPDTVVARLGGDEFATLLPPMSTDEADAAAERIAGALHRPVFVDGVHLLCHGSVGVAHAGDVDPDGGTAPVDARELLRRTDVAMYVAKARGKQRFARYEPEMDHDAEQDAQLAAQLRQAMDGAELHLVYQPIVELPDGRIVGAEALVRWHHGQRGPIPPGVFIPVAERSGLIVPLGEWILREACRQAAQWRHDGLAALDKVSVNVSARQLRQPEFPATVAAVLAETGLPASHLAIEVTETAVFDDGVALDSVIAIHGLGVTIALDDFGTGHSSLGLLRTCPVGLLKVDKSFVDEVGTDNDQTVIANALIQIADGLRLQAVAEGVETAEQVAELKRLGYRYAQGYHFARPMPPEELTALLHAQPVAAAAA